MNDDYSDFFNNSLFKSTLNKIMSKLDSEKVKEISQKTMEIFKDKELNGKNINVTFSDINQISKFTQDIMGDELVEEIKKDITKKADFSVLNKMNQEELDCLKNGLDANTSLTVDTNKGFSFGDKTFDISSFSRVLNKVFKKDSSRDKYFRLSRHLLYYYIKYLIKNNIEWDKHCMICRDKFEFRELCCMCTNSHICHKEC